MNQLSLLPKFLPHIDPPKYIEDLRGNAYRRISECIQLYYTRYYCHDKSRVARYDWDDASEQWYFIWDTAFNFYHHKVRVHHKPLSFTIDAAKYDERLIRHKLIRHGFRNFILDFRSVLVSADRHCDHFLVAFKDPGEYTYFLFLFSEHIPF